MSTVMGIMVVVMVIGFLGSGRLHHKGAKDHAPAPAHHIHEKACTDCPWDETEKENLN